MNRTSPMPTNCLASLRRRGSTVLRRRAPPSSPSPRASGSASSRTCHASLAGGSRSYMAGRVWCPVRTCAAARRAALRLPKPYPAPPSLHLRPSRQRPLPRIPATPNKHPARPTDTGAPPCPDHTSTPAPCPNLPQAGDAYLKVGRAPSNPGPHAHGTGARAAAAASPLTSPRLTAQRGAGGIRRL